MSVLDTLSGDGYGALLVAPHPDDAELGCPYLLGRGTTILVVTWPSLERAEEQVRAAKVAGCHLVHIGVAEDGRLAEHQLDLVQAIEHHITTRRPAIVAAPPLDDEHQDHAAVARAVRSATRRSTLTVVEYETPSTPPSWTPDTFPVLGTASLTRQVDAVAEHRSQLGHPYTQADAIRARARRWGARIGHEYADAYRTVRRASL